MLQLPKSICVLTTHQKHLCCHTYLTTTKKNNKTPNCKNPQKSDILRVRCGAICTPRSFSLLLAFRHGPKCECENLASHPKKKLSSFGSPFGSPYPPSSRWGNAPCGSALLLAIGQYFRSSSFQQSPPPCPINYMMLGSIFMLFRQKTDVSKEGTRQVMVHLAARWPKFSSLFGGTGCAQRRHSCAVQGAVQRHMQERQLREMFKSFIKNKCQTLPTATQM